jgi:serine/threonine protein kinase
MSSENKALKSFNSLLKRVRKKPVLGRMAERLSLSEKQKIIDFVLSNNTQRRLSRIEVGDGMVFQRKQRGKARYYPELPRSISVLRTKQNKFRLITETKSKVADHSLSSKKTKAPLYSGAFKIGKEAWDIGEDNPVPVISFREKILDDEDFNLEEVTDSFKKEIKLSNSLTSERCVHVHHAGFFSKGLNRQHSKIIVDKGNCNLLSFILDLQFGRTTISFRQKERMIYSLLLMLKDLHDKNIIHQDFKLLNIIIFNDYKPKCIDFGVAYTPEQSQQQLTGSIESYSPEMYWYFVNVGKTSRSKRLKAKCLGIKKRENDHNTYLASFFNKKIKNKTPFVNDDVDINIPDKANDIWAMGVIILELEMEKEVLLYNRSHSYYRYQKYCKAPSSELLRYINKHPLLKHMLQAKREDRKGIDELIEVFKQNSQYLNAESEDKAQEKSGKSFS